MLSSEGKSVGILKFIEGEFIAPFQRYDVNSVRLNLLHYPNKAETIDTEVEKMFVLMLLALQVYSTFKLIRDKFQNLSPNSNVAIYYEMNGVKEERKPEDDNQTLRPVEYLF